VLRFESRFKDPSATFSILLRAVDATRHSPVPANGYAVRIEAGGPQGPPRATVVAFSQQGDHDGARNPRRLHWPFRQQLYGRIPEFARPAHPTDQGGICVSRESGWRGHRGHAAALAGSPVGPRSRGRRGSEAMALYADDASRPPGPDCGDARADIQNWKIALPSLLLQPGAAE